MQMPYNNVLQPAHFMRWTVFKSQFCGFDGEDQEEGFAVQFYEFLKLFIYVALYGMLLVSIWELLKSFSASKWPKTKGEIIRSSIEEEHDSEGGTYTPHIEYRYAVNGKEYISKTYAFGYLGGSSFPSVARNLVNKYPSKSSVVVYYNAKKHSEAVLMPGIKAFHLFKIIFLCVFVFVLMKIIRI